MELKENERIDDLEYKGLKIIQNKNNFCFGIDSVILSDFSKGIKKDNIVLDLGTGTGIIGLLLCKKTKLKKIIGVEIQKEVFEIAKRNINLNNLENKFDVINENIKNLPNLIEAETIDAVVTNPPYKKSNTGVKNENINKLISRHEIECTLEDIIKVSTKLLKNKGEFFMVHRPERIVDIFCLLRKYKLEPKIIRYVYSKFYTEPKLVLIKAIKNGGNFLQTQPPIYIYNEDNSYTEEILKIYNKKNDEEEK